VMFRMGRIKQQTIDPNVTSGTMCAFRQQSCERLRAPKQSDSSKDYEEALEDLHHPARFLHPRKDAAHHLYLHH
jgi:hypothetical protein